MWDWLKEAVYWVASATDAYFHTDLPQETWEAFVDTCREWLTLAMDYLYFIVDFIARAQGG